MQGLQKFVCTAVLCACGVSSAWGQPALPNSYDFEVPAPARAAKVAERTQAHISLYSPDGASFRSREITVPGATFIKLHFSGFSLPDGVTVEISNPDGSETWRYSNEDLDEHTVDFESGDDGFNSFSAMSITGDTVIVRILGDLRDFDPLFHRLEIDSWLEGLPLEKAELLNGGGHKDKSGGRHQLENSCGSDERYDSVCWADSNPWEYERSAAVAKLITSQGEVCTAWRVGSDNHMFTAEHCLGKQSELDGAEIWFNYEAQSCGGSSNASAVKVSGGSLLAKSKSLDYTLFTVSNFSSISSFPSFGLDTDTPPVGEPIFIPQHGLGRPRQIALESDMNSSGECEVDANDLNGYAVNSDIGYYCDTATSSSGSPVISNISGRAVALHHFGGCMNSGVKFSEIWPEVKGYFGGKVPGGSSGGGGGSSGSDNEPPNADLSVNCDVLSCSFDGGDSSDGDGEIESYSWDLGDGSSEIGSSFQYEYAEAGTYTVTLTVEDDEGDSDNASETITLVVPNSRPKASFSANCVANSCEFDGSKSSDEDGEIESLYWSLGDGSNASGTIVNHVYEEAGSYSVRLTAVDDDGAENYRTKYISVVLPNEEPTASFEFSCDELNCSFDSSGSSDIDGEIVSWNWTFGDGTSAEGTHVVHSYSEGGSYQVELTVEDNRGDSDSSTRTANPSVSNTGPSADFSFNCEELDCTFDAGASFDPDGNLTAWNWTFGDGASGSGQSQSHRYGSEGTYSVVLSVTDNDGASDSRTRTVSVTVMPPEPEPEPEPEPKPEPEPEPEPKPEPEPEPKANENPHAEYSFECKELECSFDASASYDSDGTVKAYQWTFGDGASASGSKTSHRFDSNGSYQVRLEVSDNNGARDTLSRSVKVEEYSSNSAPRARFSIDCNELSCRFDAGSSSDPDGTVISYRWTIGDGAVLGGQSVQHQFASDGVYQVTLEVEDNTGETGSTSRTVKAEKDRPEITLTGTGRQNNGRSMATLRWSGAESETVELYRDGILIASTGNDGKLIDTTIDGHAKSATYQLCQPASGYCSDTLVLMFLADNS